MSEDVTSSENVLSGKSKQSKKESEDDDKRQSLESVDIRYWDVSRSNQSKHGLFWILVIVLRLFKKFHSKGKHLEQVEEFLPNNEFMGNFLRPVNLENGYMFVYPIAEDKALFKLKTRDWFL